MELIAELGNNHNGDLDLAKQMILSACDSGATCVKFQKRTPEICIPESQKNMLRSTPWGTMSYLNYRRRLEFGKTEFDVIDKFCRDIGISWSASAWDIQSASFLIEYDIPFLKIASATVTNTELLKFLSTIDIPIIMSTGMSTELEIETAVDLLNDNLIGILHCVSSYPTDTPELNLNKIITLQNKYPDITIGYSGHEIGFIPTLIARSMGAEIIERHFTTDRNLWGTDQSISLLPDEFKAMTDLLNQIPDMLGSGKLEVMPSEVPCINKLRKP